MSNYLHHWLLQPLFFLLVNNTLCFSWLSILEHMFFSCFTYCGNINIHHIHIRNYYLCFYNRLKFYYCHKFPMKHFLHLNKLWTICHLMSIQTTNVICIWRCLLCFLIWLCFLCGCHRGLLFVLSTCCTLWFVIPQFVQCLLVFLVLLCVFVGTTCLILYGIDSALLVSIVVIPSSHNIAASICCCSVDHFILVVAILKYDCKLALNIIVKKLSVVGTCKPWTSFWIHS